ncbi:MAG: alpha/beta hydrolase [Anaerolineae bacterium]|nr:alpha/beta hydrolase [Anaerolineae bacterium]
MPIIETPHGNLFYAESNLTLPFILIHGSASSHLGWPAELRRFPNRRVFTIDLPGHGRVPGAGCDSIEGYAKAVVALMDTLSISKAILVGHSMGGAIALHMAWQMPERVGGVILIGTGAHLPVNPFILEQMFKDKQAVIEKINQWSWARGANPQLQKLALKALEATSPELIHADYAACNQFDMREVLDNIQIPALVIGGTMDKMTPPAYSEFLAEKLPHATLEWVVGGGHWMMLEHPARIAEIIGEWLHDHEI